MSHFTTIKTQNQRHRRSVLGRSGNGPVPAAGDPEDHAFTPSTGNLAIYLRAARYPIASAAPLLLKEAEQKPGSVTILEAFEFLGEAARPAIPYILREFNARTYRGNMMSVLRHLGPVASEAAPAMTTMLSDDDPGVVAAALSVLKSIGPGASSSLLRLSRY